MSADAGERKIGFWTCTALVVGNTIGMGIFLLPASLAPFGLNALLGWALVIAGALCLAAVFSQLSRHGVPGDGPYQHLRRAFGPLTAFIGLWSYWVSLWVTNAALAIGVVGYAQTALPALQHWNAAILATGLVWLFVAINAAGVRAGGSVQIITSVLKLLPMAVVIALGAALLGTEPQRFQAPQGTPSVSLAPVLAAATIALYAMLGVESAAVPASRVRDAARIIPRATLVGTALVATVYVLVSAIPMFLLPTNVLAASSAPFALVLDALLMPGSGQWLAWFVVISGLGALNGWTLLVGELSADMAGHRLLPGFLAARNTRGAPHIALFTTGVMAMVMVAMSQSASLVDGFTFLSTVVTAASLPLYLLCALAVWRQGGGKASPAALVIAAGAIVFVVLAAFGMGSSPLLWGMALILSGLPLFAWLRSRKEPACA